MRVLELFLHDDRKQGLQSLLPPCRHFVNLCGVLVGLALLVPGLLCGQAGGEYWDNSAITANLRYGIGAPDARNSHSTVNMGGKLFMWCGQVDGTNAPWRNTGGIYDPVLDVWEFRPNLASGFGAPAARRNSAAVWTGSHIVACFGEVYDPNITVGYPLRGSNNGGVYDPATDVWLSRPVLQSGTNAPVARYSPYLVWTGTQVVGFGGTTRDSPTTAFPLSVVDGFSYDPASDQWVASPALNSPLVQPWFNNYLCVWLGDGFLCRGGDGGPGAVLATGIQIFSAGGVYSTASSGWLNKPVLRGLSAPPRAYMATAWTGEYYVEFGGHNKGPSFSSVYNNGRIYDPALDEYLVRQALDSGLSAPAPRIPSHFAWTGSHLFVWSGFLDSSMGSQPMPSDGGLYDPVRDEWISAPNLNGGIGSPNPRGGIHGFWDGSRFILWGGANYQVNYNTGAVYVPPRVAPTIRSGQVGAALQANTFFRHRVTVYGCPRATVGVMGMPGWMTQKWLDTGCFLEGTPNAAEALQTSTITITADNGIGTFAMQTIVVGPPAPAFIDPIPNLNAEVGPRFEYRIPAGGPPYPALSATGMPSWMSIVSGRIEGYPTQADLNQVSTITVTADNGVGVPATRTFTVTVIPPIPPGGTAPQFTTPAQLSTVAAESFSMLLTATGSPTPVFSLQNPPAWLGLVNDILSGTPPASLSGQTINVTLQASNNVPPAATATLALTILHHPTDVTRDAAIDVVDVQRVVNLILALGVEAYPGEGDANGDSVVDVVDVQAVVNKILAP